MKKFIIFTLALVVSALAEAKTSDGEEDLYDSDIYTTQVMGSQKGSHFMMDLGVGSAFDFNVRWNHQFGDKGYVTWDALSAGLLTDWSKKGKEDEYDTKHYYYADMKPSIGVKATTGVRGFSPSFANGKIRAYLSVNGGVACEWVEFKELEGPRTDFFRGVIDGSVGIQIKKVYLGYTLMAIFGGYENWVMIDKNSDINHGFRIGVRF